MADPTAMEKLTTELDARAQEAMRKAREVLKEGQETHIKQYEILTSLLLRMLGYILVGGTAGILTVLQYLLSMQNEPVSSALATFAILSFAFGVTAASVAFMQFHRSVTAEKDMLLRLLLHLTDIFTTFGGPLFIKSVADWTPEDIAKLKPIRQSLILEQEKFPALRETVFMRPVHSLVKCSALLFLLGLWLSVLAASEHLWHWSGYLILSTSSFFAKLTFT